jgi:crossover junction endodeoxyribonuclease RuvC
MIVVGIDPGSRLCGYAVINVHHTSMTVLEAGTWRLFEKNALGFRLERLHALISELFQKFNPRLVGLEKAVVFKNIPSALVLSEARGVIRLAAFQSLESAEQRLIEISPTEVKRTGTGSGKSSKKTLEKLMSMRFGRLPLEYNASSDTFDAIAIAWTTWIVHNKSYERKTRA